MRRSKCSQDAAAGTLADVRIPLERANTMDGFTSYVTPTVTGRGSVQARTLGCLSHATLEIGGSYRCTSLRISGRDPYGDMDVILGGRVFSVEKKADGTGRNLGTDVVESVSDLD
jgi:hypothetical protein